MDAPGNRQPGMNKGSVRAREPERERNLISQSGGKNKSIRNTNILDNS